MPISQDMACPQNDVACQPPQAFVGGGVLGQPQFGLQCGHGHTGNALDFREGHRATDCSVSRSIPFLLAIARHVRPWTARASQISAGSMRAYAALQPRSITQPARLDSDQDVDQSDFAGFHRSLSGPDVPAEPH